MSGQNLLAEYERAVLRDPENLGLRLQLAAALRDAGRLGDAVAEFRFVAVRYHRQGHLEHAAAVCRAVLAIDPAHDEMQAMLASLGPTVAPTAPAQRLPLAAPSADTGPRPAVREPTQRRTVPPLASAAAAAAPPQLPPTEDLRPAPRRARTVTGPPARQGSPFGDTPLPPPAPPPPQEKIPRRPLAAIEEDVATDPGLAEDPRFGLASLLEEDVPPFPLGGQAHETIAGSPGARRKTGVVAVPAPPPPAEDPMDLATTLEQPPRPRAEVEPELQMPRAFAGDFREALDALGPDGSALEESLAVFRELPGPALHELSRRVTPRRFTAGEVVVREGEPGDAVFVVNSGSVSVRKRVPQSVQLTPAGGDASIEVVRLGAGALFGEFALLADRRRHATVTALEASEIFEIPRHVLVDLTRKHPEVGPALERLYRERLLANLLTTAPFFQPLPVEDRTRLMARFQPMRAEPSQVIVQQGERTGGFFLVLLGQVVIAKRIARHERPLVTLGEGAYFGEMSLLRGTTASASVTAQGACELAVLAPQDFYAVMASYPILWEELRREAKRREQVTRHLTGGSEQQWV